jgi:translation initiation factor 2D
MLLSLFAAISSKGNLYTSTQVGQILNDYINAHNLANQNEKAYVNLDDVLYACVSSRRNPKAQLSAKDEKPLQFMRRDELVRIILQRMQSWYEVRTEGRDVVTE